MILSKTFNDELQKYTTLDLLRMLKEYEDYNDSVFVMMVAYEALLRILLIITLVHHFLW